MPTRARNYGVLTDLDKLRSYANGVLERGLPLGFDVETGYDGPDRIKGSLLLDWPNQFVCGFSVSHNPEFARYIPLRHETATNANPEDAWEIMRPLLTRGNLVIHNSKFELRNVRKAAGYDLASEGGHIVDTMLDAYVLSEHGFQGAIRGAVGLKDLVKIIFDHDQATIQSLFPLATTKQLKCLRFNVLDLTPEVVSYCCEDASWALALVSVISSKAEAERRPMRRIEHETASIMGDVEEHGVLVDWTAMEHALAEATTFAPAMERATKDGLSELAGRDLSALSINSPPQLQKLLYRDIGLQTTRLTKGAKAEREPWEQMSTDAIAMEGLSKQHTPIRKLLDLREAENMRKRLEKWLTEFRYAPDNRVHANYNQVVVGTGRFAANDPAIQQCPKEWRWSTKLGLDCWADDLTEWLALTETGTAGKDFWTGNFRDFIIAGPDSYLLTFDYSQIELRVLAGESQEPALMRAFNDDVDIHRLTAAMMLGKKPENVSDKDRDVGKTMNFALIYGMGPKSLAERLGISMTEAKTLYAQYFAAFSRIGTWQDATTARGLRLGYSETRFGRKYTVWELRSDNRAIYAKGERVLTNAPIQGGAADYMKLAMIRAARRLKQLGWWRKTCTITMNQHDALTFEVSNDIDPAEARRQLEEAVVFPVPGYPKIVAEWELGQKWGSSTKWKEGLEPIWDGERWTLGRPDETAAVPTPGETVATNAPYVGDTGDSGHAPQITNIVTTSTNANQRIVHADESIYVETDDTPTRPTMSRLLDYVAERPGTRETWLRCPLAEMRLGTSSLCADDQPSLSLLLGGAKIRRGDSETMAEELAASLNQ